MIENLKHYMPWWIRICAKLILSRLPVSYRFWKGLHLFEHGDMNQPEKSFDSFINKARIAGVLNKESNINSINNNEDFVVLELGPGDSLFTAPIAKALGAKKVWLVDVGSFASKDIKIYDALFSLLQNKGIDLPFKSYPDSTDELLDECNCCYLINGIQSLKQIPISSVDYCFSNAVLEHVRKNDFELLVDELFRIIKPGGVCVHTVDLKDHLGGKLNNLRFSDSTWEGELFSSSGFYTNRIRFNEMLSVFRDAGFTYTLPRVLRWNELPVSRKKMNIDYGQLSDDDLLISGFDVVLIKPLYE
jgi:SAM-dependent methyltransferase